MLEEPRQIYLGLSDLPNIGGDTNGIKLFSALMVLYLFLLQKIKMTYLVFAYGFYQWG